MKEISIKLPKEIIEKRDEILTFSEKLGIDTKKIGDITLLLLSFVHKSFAADFKTIGSHNERLEFLGDGVLGAVICKLLFVNHPEMEESDMTLYKIALVREETLADVARNINLGEHILISNGEEKMGGRDKNSILSDTLEAFIGAIFLSLGYEHVEKFVKNYVYSMYDKVDKNPVQSYKTMVQELVQKKYKQIPSYIDSEYKIDNNGNVILYKSELIILGRKVAQGFAKNKKKAQEDAAKNYYNQQT